MKPGGLSRSIPGIERYPELIDRFQQRKDRLSDPCGNCSELRELTDEFKALVRARIARDKFQQR